MIIDGVEIQNFLIKACSEESHAQDIANGNIYMKKIMYYRWLENKYMGDWFDGLGPISGLQILDKDGKNFFDEFPDLVACIGNLQENKPVFCASIIDERIAFLRKNSIVLRKKFINEMKKFGKYFVIFNGAEFSKHANDWCIKNNLHGKARIIDYCDIKQEFKGTELLRKGYVEHFFKKDFRYEKQNEWRFILFDDSLIKEDRDFFIMDIGKLNTATIMTVDEFEKFTLEL